MITTTMRVLLLLLPVAGAAVILVQLGRTALRMVPRRVAIAGAGAAAAVLVGGIAMALVPTTRPPPIGAPRESSRTAPSTTYETPDSSLASPATTTENRVYRSTTDAPAATITLVPSRLPVARTDAVTVPPDQQATGRPSGTRDCELLGLPLPVLLCDL